MASSSRSTEISPPQPAEVPPPQLIEVGKEKEKTPVQESSECEHLSSPDGAAENSGAEDTVGELMPRLKVSGWSKSEVKEEDQNKLEKEGVILPRVMVPYRAACGENFPTPKTHETVVFIDFLKCGLSFLCPSSSFKSWSSTGWKSCI